MTVQLKSYACGAWHTPEDAGRTLVHAVTGEPVARASSTGLDFAAMLDHGRSVGGRALRAMSFAERAALLKSWAGVLNQHLETFYACAAAYGATKRDAWMDIEGGISTIAVYASLGRKQLPAGGAAPDGDVAGLSKEGTFVGRHIHVPLEGVAVQINAYNFPAWGMLEKLAPQILAGVPAIVKPATATAWLTYEMIRVLIESGEVPEGVLQLICGSVGDLLDHLTCQDVVGFTGSAAVGTKLKAHPAVVRNAVRFNLEADSLNCAVLGDDVGAEDPVFASFVREVATEMTFKAGQKCTAIRRVFVPADRTGDVVDALRERLAKTVVGDPAVEGVRMGPLVDAGSAATAKALIAELGTEAEIVIGDPARSAFEGVTGDASTFLEPIVLVCREPATAAKVHEIEVFGPVTTIIPYGSRAEAIALARKGGGSLCGSIYTEDESVARELTFGLAPFHGRLMVLNAAARESTGHGTVMPQLIHGGPGRAGGGEELGGLRAVYHYMQRVALQGSPDRLEGLCTPAS